MYEEYFGLTRKPFSIVPDPRYFFTSNGHREALAHLLYGIKSDSGFVLLTGEVGTGKTTVCRRLLELMPDGSEVAFILNPKLTVEELLATICDEFGIIYPESNTSIKVFVARINDYLLDVHARGRRAVLIIEEAQNLRPEVLEQIRLLTNLETKEHKLLQMIMIGQPELRDILSQPQLRQLSQRITARYHLGPLSREEIPEYVNYRLSVAGLVRGVPFPPRILGRLFRLSGGVPRLINVICDRALLGAYVQGKDKVDMKTLTTAAREVSGEEGHQRRRRRRHQGILAGIFLVLLASIGTVYFMTGSFPLSRTPVATVDVEPVATTKENTMRAATLERPVSHTAESTREIAYAALFSQWHVPYSQEDSRAVCDQAKVKGLRCLQGRDSISSLRQMNKPVALRLTDDKSGEVYYATLTSLVGNTASFVIGNETRSVVVKEIARWWSGDYLLLWRAPREYREVLKPGDRGPIVAWVDRQLALLAGRPAATGNAHVYAGEIVKQVKKFQVATGMIPDGVVGPRTIMGLSAASATGEPVLDDKKGSY